jgi:hypothetical protein
MGAKKDILNTSDIFTRRLFLGGCISCCWPNGRANGIGTGGVLRDREVNQRMTTHLVGRHGGCSIGAFQWQQTADTVLKVVAM